jgi:Domain of unknown function (DUF4345)
MTLLHKALLYGLLGFLSISLVLPGLVELCKSQPGSPGLVPSSLDAKNQFRALQGMMVGVGALALWACLDLEHARMLVLALGVVMSVLVAARLYSLMVDGMPGFMTLIYLAVEGGMAVAFLIWPPPR